ncbi:MAG: peptide deformylase [Alphaproteobacteria bacterium]|nr:peptide deformylase [Alphaproteobacteria bacterium]
MVLPVVAYGSPILRQISKPITPDFDNLKLLIDNMFQTMYHADGVGLSACQIGISIQLFIFDTIQIEERYAQQHYKIEKGWGRKSVIINPEILQISKATHEQEEGCLSIPGLRSKIIRPSSIKVKYLNENFQEIVEELEGLNGRVFLHELDHLKGILLIDHISSLKRKLWAGKLQAISNLKIDTEYKMTTIK